MAKFIEYKTIEKKDYEQIIQHGYYPISMYGKQKIDESIKEWIENNVDGCWSTFSFSIPTFGQSYCFSEENDAMAFKLMFE